MRELYVKDKIDIINYKSLFFEHYINHISEGHKLNFFPLKLDSIYRIESCRLHLHFNVFLLGIILEFLYIFEILFENKSILLHPSLETSLFREDTFLELVPIPYYLNFLLRLLYISLCLFRNKFLSFCFLFEFQLFLSNWI